MDPPFDLLSIPPALFQGMLDHALGERPCECCGLLAGQVFLGPRTIGQVSERYPLVNARASAVEFESEPRGMFEAVRDIRRRGIDILGIYHSHPTSAPVP